MTNNHLPLAILLAATAACAPAPSATTDAPEATTQTTAPYQPDFLLMTERSTSEQREAARAALLAEFARIGVGARGGS